MSTIDLNKRKFLKYCCFLLLGLPLLSLALKTGFMQNLFKEFSEPKMFEWIGD